ncbi:MAG: UDP-N-acetylglucosamine 1-carboxyvinyltransferase [Pirellulales bacterium]
MAFRITGGFPLNGTVAAGGSKNAALPIMAASILAHGPVRLFGVPRLVDVETLALLLAELGLRVERSGTADGGDPASPTAGDSLLLQTIDETPTTADYDLVRSMRAGFCVLGPLLARRGRAVVSLPGGCAIGDRPVDLHLAGLVALGADVRIEHGYVVASARRLVGARLHLTGTRGPTVTGTANLMSAATLAEGVTTITGAAVEPEIVDLGQFLIAMGAQIAGLGTPTLQITGVERLAGAAYSIIPDRIEAATLLLAAAITGGSATVTHVRPDHLVQVLAALEATGARVEAGEDRVEIHGPKRPRATDITALPYPGIPTDLQAQWMALAAIAEGRSVVCDRIFPDRFLHVAELNRLGARIRRDGAVAVVTGVEKLTGAEVMASDLRASAALVLAGLAAEGTTIVRRIYHLDRGYERLEVKLARLGARIVRE